MTQLSNVPMQPNPSSVEPLTLVERIQPILDDLMMECFKHGFHQKEMTEAEFIDYSRKNCVPPKREIIGILKQHQAESGWVAYEDERKPKDKSRVLAFDGRREFIALYDKGFYIVANGEYYGCVTHWMELPLPPHDSKGGAYEQDLYQIEKEKGKFFEPSEVQDD